jgi:hypothetical protein
MSAPDFTNAQWRKSSRSGGNGGQCIEVAVTWRKSSHSGGNGGNCVEVARTQATIGLRDSKNPGAAVLAVDVRRFTAFIAAVRADRFTR